MLRPCCEADEGCTKQTLRLSLVYTAGSVSAPLAGGAWPPAPAAFTFT
jgi:hypothetical protein